MLRLRPAISLLVAYSLVGACGSTPSPTAAPGSSAPAVTASPSAAAAASPTATPVVTPSPSPSPADVSAAFNKALTDPLFAAHVTTKGVAQVAGVTITTQGTMDVNAGVSHTVTTTVAAGKSTTSETLDTGAKNYEKKYGVWFEAARTPGSLAGVIQAAGGFRDAGLERVEGRSLHHMTLPPGTVVPPSAVGATGSGISDAAVTLEAWADEQGKPVAMKVSVKWTQSSGSTSVPATLTMDLTIADSAGPVAVPTDDDIWAIKVSKVHGYEIAYPITWDYAAGTAKKADEFVGVDGSYLFVWHGASKGYTANEYASSVAKNLNTYTGGTKSKLIANRTVKVAGRSARQLEFSTVIDGATYYGYVVVFAKGNYLYTIDYYVPHKLNAESQATLATFLATYAFK